MSIAKRFQSVGGRRGNQIPLLTVDPGEHTGWALFDPSKLVACGVSSPLLENLHWCSGVPGRVDAILFEVPVVYPHSKARPEDVATLSLRAGVAVGIAISKYPHALVGSVEPRKWKGTINGDVMGRRILDRLSGDDRRAYEEGIKPIAEGLQHNVLDAVGIGLFAQGRL